MSEAQPQVTPEVKIARPLIIAGVVSEILDGIHSDTDVPTVIAKFKRLSDGFIGGLTEAQFARTVAAVMTDCGWKQYPNQKSRWFKVRSR